MIVHHFPGSCSFSHFSPLQHMEALKLLQHSKNTFTEFPVVTKALGYTVLASRCQTAHPPCPSPLSTGSSPPTNLPAVGQAALMRRAGNHSSTCRAALGKRHKCGATTCMSRCTHVPLLIPRGKFWNRLKYPVCTLEYVNKAADKQVRSWCQIFKALLKIFLDRPVITSSSLRLAHSRTSTHTNAHGSVWNVQQLVGSGVLFTPAHLRLSLELQSYHTAALNHFFVT